ncbi:MAG: hypothetical protein ACOY3I_02700 [Verrucomicrobiota bacterium]
MKNFILAWILLMAWGVVKTPWEHRMQAHLQRLQHGIFVPLSREMRSQLGQGLALASLGGFRGLAANFIWLKVTESWEKIEWVRLREFAEMATLLQPRVPFFWEMGAWHMAWNASASSENFQKNSSSLKNKIEARRWIDAGKNFLERGLQTVPDDAYLFLRMGDLYWQKLDDPKTAALYYIEAAKRPNALPFVERYAGVALEKAGEDRMAYEYYIKLWRERNNPHALHPRFKERNSTLERQIRKFEKKLQIPISERIFSLDA